MIIIATMKVARHEILKAKWQEVIKRHNESGMPIKPWCEENHISTTQFYYWLRVIRQESLIQAGTLAVTGQTKFVEVKASHAELKINKQGTCAILRSNGNEIEILNGADPNTLGFVLNLIGKL